MSDGFRKYARKWGGGSRGLTRGEMIFITPNKGVRIVLKGKANPSILPHFQRNTFLALKHKTSTVMLTNSREIAA